MIPVEVVKFFDLCTTRVTVLSRHLDMHKKSDAMDNAHQQVFNVDSGVSNRLRQVVSF
jgi:hypothetical protein